MVFQARFGAGTWWIPRPPRPDRRSASRSRSVAELGTETARQYEFGPLGQLLSTLILPDLLQVRAPFLNFHVLRDEGGLCLIDSGFMLLFSADFFSSYGRRAGFHRRSFNSIPAQSPGSVERALAFGSSGMLPNHGNRSSAAEHLDRLRALHGRMSESRTAR